jgi:DNA-binding response OmpR family regulator
MKKILIVDDEAGFTRLIKLTLEKTGHSEVIEENDCSRAWETARTCRPDLILLDIVMPKSDGGDVASKIKSDWTLKNIPVVFLTAIVSQRETAPGALIGGYPFISKPVSLDALIKCIEANLPPPGNPS